MTIEAFWTPARSSILVRLWSGGMSASLVAIEIGTTRDAVLGRVRRMGLNRTSKRPSLASTQVQFLASADRRPPRQMQRLPAVDRVWSLPENERRYEMARRAARAALRTRLELEALNE